MNDYEQGDRRPDRRAKPWVPDPRRCENCDGLGVILDFTEGAMYDCDDCEGTGTEYRDRAAVERRREGR